MFSRATDRIRRRDVRFQPVADRLECRIALNGELISAVDTPGLVDYSGPIYAGGDGQASEVRLLESELMTPVVI